MAAVDVESGFAALLNYLRQSRGFDFGGYKRAGLMRRVQKRLSALHLSDFEAYQDYLEVHPDEFGLLFDAILINVTGFFRDPETWDYVRDEVIPRILAARRPGHPIRVWSAGCASGEETYTVAILLAEALGVDQVETEVKLYATDVDDAALATARQASYSARELAGVPPELRDKYFENANDRYSVRKDLRRLVVFGRHDLVQDAPISRIDLLICRNTLMYFNSEAQAKILTRFHFALNDTGFLVLGKAEMLLTHGDLFVPVDLRRRVFAKARRAAFGERLLTAAARDRDRPANGLLGQMQLREAAFDAGPVAQVVMDRQGLLVLANERARALFGLAAWDIGRPMQDLEFSYRPADLRSCIDQVYAERHTISLKEVERLSGPAAPAYLDIDVVPLVENGAAIGVSITFADVSEQRQLRQDNVQSKQEVQTAYEELQSTNEELETTNEELQSTVEELETTNEELQSTNEELETLNEELQSTNEELETLNEELNERSTELVHANAFLQSILTSLRGGVAVLDRDMQIQVWSDQSEDLWGLRPDEAIGKHFLNLDIGLPVEQLQQLIRSCIAGESDPREVTVDARNRRGKMMRCTVTCTPLLGGQQEIRGVILIMEERERGAHAE